MMPRALATHSPRHASPPASLTSIAGLDSRAYQQVEDAIYDFERARAAGAAQSLDAYLPAERELRRVALLELIRVDLELRAAEGRPADAAEYARRYPELGDPDELIAILGQPSISNAGSSQEHHSKEAATPAQEELGGLRPGQQIGEFRLVRRLGAGAFGQVFLAEQQALERVVALKISQSDSFEARTLARLEHEAIVRVYSEAYLTERRLRVIAMQYVPGTTLFEIIRALHATENGATDDAAHDEVGGKIAALLRRKSGEGAEGSTLCEKHDSRTIARIVCRIGAALADALAHAHRQGVLHRDIKPANILVNPDGKPFLTDFNLSSVVDKTDDAAARERCGGTLRYMAPEHLEAFVGPTISTSAAVDERSDIYSLGLVLYELATGAILFPDVEADVSLVEMASRMAAMRRSDRSLRRPLRGLHPAISAVIERCLRAQPCERYSSADELATALRGAAKLVSIDEQFRPRGRREPSLPVAIAGIMLPHAIGVALNMMYANVQFAATLSAENATWLASIQLVYALLAFALSNGATYLLLRRPFDALTEPPPLLDRATMRRRVVALPYWGIVLAASAWIPALVVQQVLFRADATALPVEAMRYCTICILISASTAVTFSYFAAERLCLKYLYPPLLAGTTTPLRTAAAELAAVEPRIRVFQLLAGITPLVGTLAILFLARGDLPTEVHGFRAFAVALITLAAIGFGAALHFGRGLIRSLAHLTTDAKD